MMNLIVRKLSILEEHYFDTICELLASSYDQELSKFFIYSDGNYKSHLANNIKESKDLIYIALNTAEDELMGFAQVKVIDNVLFLNNIIVEKRFRSHKVGSALLKSIFHDLSHMHSLALDVFEKNESVLNWYLRLGMKIKESKRWYNLIDKYAGADIQSGQVQDISVSRDEHGFSQVSLGKQQIGTLINGMYLILRQALNTDDLIDLKKYFQDKLIGLCLVSGQELDFEIIGTSLRLEIELSELTF